jgi:hypothetical protein
MSEFFAALIARADQRYPVVARRQRAIFEPLTPRRGSTSLARSAFEEVLAEEETVIRNGPVGSAPLARVDDEEGPRHPAGAAASPSPEDNARRGAHPPVLETESAQTVRTTPQIAARPEPATPPRQLLERNARNRLEVPAIRPPMRPVWSVVTGAVPPPQSSSAPDLTDWIPRPQLLASAPLSTGRPTDEKPVRKSSPRPEHRTPAVPSEAAERVSEPVVLANPLTRLPALPGVGRAVALARAVQPKVAEEPAEQAPPAPPSVQITIGRIEVRAAAPPESRPQRAAKPAVPTLSLEEYLRDRIAGAR